MQAALRHLRALCLAVSVCAAPAAAETVLDRQVRGVIEEGFVTALLLTDGETVRLGCLNFDPNDVLPVNDELLGSETAVAERDKLGFFSLPLRWRLPVTTSTWPRPAQACATKRAPHTPLPVPMCAGAITCHRAGRWTAPSPAITCT